MKVLVAGGAGYVGSMLVPELLNRGYEVDVVDLLWFGNHLPPEVNVHKRDILDLGVEDLRGYDQVIFLAGLSNDPMAEFDPAKNFISNSAVPTYLAFQSKAAGVKRFILASSCSVYGYTIDELYNENSPATCQYPYGISKLQAEKGCLQLTDDNFSVIALRKGTVCGYSQRMRFDLIINTMFKFAMTTGEITVNNPAIWRPLLDIRDAVQGYIRAMETDSRISGIFNITSENYTVGMVGDIVREEIEKKLGRKIKLNIKHIQDFRNYKVSSEKAKTVLGFSPQYGIKDTIKSIIEHLPEYEDFSKKSFYNIETFKEL